MTRRGWIAFATVSVLWGVPYFFIKVAVDDVPAVFVAWARIALGAVVLLPVAWRAGAFRGLRERRNAILAFTVVEVAIPFTMVPVGERYVSSSLTAILIAAVPLTVAALAIRFAPEERPRGPQLVGMLVGLAGVVALVGLDVAGSARELLGAGCLLIATVGYSGGPMIVRKRLGGTHPLGPVAISLALSAVLLAPLAALSWPHHVPPAKVFASIAILGVLCTATALAVMMVLIAEAGPSRASIVTYVNPIIAVTLGVAFLGEHLGPGAIVGLVLILAGSWLATGGRGPGGRSRLVFGRRADGLPRPSAT